MRVTNPCLRNSAFGWMAERSKALVSGTSLFGGEGSNPSSVTPLFYFFLKLHVCAGAAPSAHAAAPSSAGWPSGLRR